MAIEDTGAQPNVAGAAQPQPSAQQQPTTVVVPPSSTTVNHVGVPQEKVDEQVGQARTQGRRAGYKYLEQQLGVPLLNEAGELDLNPLRLAVEQARGKDTEATAKVKDLEAQIAQRQQEIAERDGKITAAEQRALNTLRRSEAKLLARELGFADPADAVLFLGDLSRFEADADAGTVTGLEDALKELATTKPYLLKPATTDQGGGETADDKGDTPPAKLPLTPQPNPPKPGSKEDELALADLHSFARDVF